MRIIRVGILLKVFERKKHLRVWSPYNKVFKDGGKRKIPISVKTGRWLSHETMNERTTLMGAVAAFRAGVGHGIGIYRHPNDDCFDVPLVLIDLDSVVDPLTGVISAKAVAIIKHFGNYAELSQSGKGAHLYTYGKWPNRWNRKNGIEVYQYGFSVVTGNHIPWTPLVIENRQTELDNLHNEHASPQPLRRPVPRIASDYSNAEVIRRIRSNRTGELFWHGQREEAGYNDYNRADLTFVGALVAMGCSKKQIDEIVRVSGMYRDKWDDIHDPDGNRTYGEMTIDKAVENTWRRHRNAG